MNKSEKEMAKIIGNNILEARTGKVWKCVTQRDISKYVGISPTGYFNIETGKSTPKVTTLLKIAKYLNVKMEDLLKGIEV